LYIAAAAVIPIIVLIGFARSYFMRGFFDMPPIPSALVHIHGAIMTTWVLLFVTQVTLVATHRSRLHQKLGILGAALAGTVAVVGAATAISLAARGGPSNIPLLRFLAIPLVDMPLFAILVATAIYFRRRIDIHKRLMLLATLTLLSAAIARIPLHFIATGGPRVFFALTDALVLAFVVVDTVKHRRLHPVFLWGTLIVIASQPLRIMLSDTDAWLKIAAWLIK
jgi:hypothetical protein